MTSQPASELPARRAQATRDLQDGVALHRAGKIAEAEARYRGVLRQFPDDPGALHLLGVVAFTRGDHARAIALIRKALQTRPEFADAHLNLGNALHAGGHPAEAIESYRRAIALSPGNAMAHSNLARVLTDVGELDAAVASGRTAIALDPAMPAGHINTGAALVKATRFEEAETAYMRGAMLEPGRAETHRDLGAVLTELDRLDEAVLYHDRAISLKPDDASNYCARGMTRVRKSELRSAEADFRRATELDPAFPGGWLGLGWSLRLLGRFAEAEICFDRVRTIDPSRMDAYRHLATEGSGEGGAGQIERLAEQLDRPGNSARDKVVAGFALGRLLDSADRYDEAFARYEAANALCRERNEAAGAHFDLAVFRRRVDLLTEHYPRDRFPAPVGGASELPVFIVGMPRSGTTLTEQIAASHSRVFGAGELQDIGRIVDALAGESKRLVGAHQADAELAARLAHGHLLGLQRKAGGAVRAIDKMPDNVLHLGLIAQLYPGARVIFCTRDARDISLSCYFQLFADGLHPFSYDLADCGGRTSEVNRAIAHWRRVLPLKMHEVNYETLVGDLEGESRRLIAFLGLEWEPACLDFHRTERTVATISHWQVRQPLYTASVGRWRHYERHLTPLFRALDNPPTGRADQA